MPVFNDPTASTKGIKKPKPPKRPTRSSQIAPVPAKVMPRLTRRPVGPSKPNFNPAATLDTSRISDVVAPSPRASMPRMLRPNMRASDGGYLPLMGQQPQSNGLDLGYSPSYSPNFDTPRPDLLTPQANPTETPEDSYSPYSNYADSLQAGDGYAQSIRDTGGYNQFNQDSPINPDRQPSQVLTEKEIRRKISRRGGFGLWGARSPIQGFDFDSDRNTFGHTVDPITGRMRDHTGEDMAAAAGTPIYAPAGGVVNTATPSGGAYGNQIILDHGAGEESMYGHLSGMVVTPGQKVKKGDLIGYVGSTGRSTGPHLHWETWKDGESLDPNTLFGRGAPPQEVLEAALAKFGGQQAPSGPPQQSNNNELAHNDGLNALMQAIREQESGGDYAVQNGIGAMGAYQIMPGNISGDAGWDMEALGHNITGQEFLNNPSLQNEIARFKLRDYFKKYGAGGAAKAWYAGPGNASLDSNSPQYGGPSVNAYAESVLALMRKYMGSQ